MKTIKRKKEDPLLNDAVWAATCELSWAAKLLLETDNSQVRAFGMIILARVRKLCEGAPLVEVDDEMSRQLVELVARAEQLAKFKEEEKPN